MDIPRTKNLAWPLALGLFLAACGGQPNATVEAEPDESGPTTAAADTEPADTEPDAEADESEDQAGSDDATDMADDMADDMAEAESAAVVLPVLSREEAAAAAEANEAGLQVADDPRDTEVLALNDGSVQSLRSVIDGKRPVLLWFWAPH